MLTASHSRETACERSLRSAPILTQPRKPDPTPHAGNDTPAAFVGTGGRLRSECMVAFNRNLWPQSPESADSGVLFSSHTPWRRKCRRLAATKHQRSLSEKSARV